MPPIGKSTPPDSFVPALVERLEDRCVMTGGLSLLHVSLFLPIGKTQNAAVSEVGTLDSETAAMLLRVMTMPAGTTSIVGNLLDTVDDVTASVTGTVETAVDTKTDVVDSANGIVGNVTDVITTGTTEESTGNGAGIVGNLIDAVDIVTSGVTDAVDDVVDNATAIVDNVLSNATNDTALENQGHSNFGIIGGVLDTVDDVVGGVTDTVDDLVDNTTVFIEDVADTITSPAVFALDTVQDVVGGVTDTVEDLADDATDTINQGSTHQNLGNSNGNGTGIVDSLLDAVQDMTSGVTDTVDDVVENATGIVDDITDTITTPAADAEEGTDDGGILGSVLDTVQDVVGGVTHTVDGLVDSTTDVVEDITDIITTPAADAEEGTDDGVILGSVLDTVEDVVGGVTETVDGLVDSTTDVVEDITDTITSPAADAEEGTDDGGILGSEVETVSDVVEGVTENVVEFVDAITTPGDSSPSAILPEPIDDAVIQIDDIIDITTGNPSIPSNGPASVPSGHAESGSQPGDNSGSSNDDVIQLPGTGEMGSGNSSPPVASGSSSETLHFLPPTASHPSAPWSWIPPTMGHGNDIWSDDTGSGSATTVFDPPHASTVPENDPSRPGLSGSGGAIIGESIAATDASEDGTITKGNSLAAANYLKSDSTDQDSAAPDRSTSQGDIDFVLSRVGTNEGDATTVASAESSDSNDEATEEERATKTSEGDRKVVSTDDVFEDWQDWSIALTGSTTVNADPNLNLQAIDNVFASTGDGGESNVVPIAASSLLAVAGATFRLRKNQRRRSLLARLKTLFREGFSEFEPIGEEAPTSYSSAPEVSNSTARVSDPPQEWIRLGNSKIVQRTEMLDISESGPSAWNK